MCIYYIYKITNKVTGEFYFGSRTAKVMRNTTPEEDLWKKYFTSSKYVKQQIAEYGKEAFTSEILWKYDDIEMTDFHEQVYIYYHINNPLCLNKHYVCPHKHTKTFSCAGTKRTPEQNRANSEHRKGKPLRRKDGTVVKNVARGHRHSDATKAKFSAIHKGKTQPRDAVERQRKAVTGRKATPEQIANQIAGQTGRVVTDATRKKIGAANAISQKGKKLSPETIAKRSATYSANWALKSDKTKPRKSAPLV